MPQYRYTAYDERGTLESGSIEAAGREAALEALARQNRFVRDLTESRGAAPLRPWWDRDLFGRTSLDPAALALFTRELATLARATLPVDEALRIVALQPLLPFASRMVARRLEKAVVEGASLSEALLAEGDAFPPYYARLVRAGESGGALAETLEDLANFIEQAKAQRDRIRSALAYPAILLAAALVSLAVIVAVLVPAIAPLFEDAGVEPPLAIAVLGSLGRFVAENVVLVTLATMTIIGSVAATLRSGAIRRRWDGVILRMPIIGRLVRCRDTARVARTLAILDRGGLPMLDALDIAAKVPANRVMQEAIAKARVDVAEGVALSESLFRSGQFGEIAVRLVTIGEKAGRLGQMLGRLADMDEAVLRRDTERLTGLVGPILTVVIGLVVGGLVLSVLGAVVGINELALR